MSCVLTGINLQFQICNCKFEIVNLYLMENSEITKIENDLYIY